MVSPSTNARNEMFFYEWHALIHKKKSTKVS
jgi:hypothetical protein